MDFKLDVRPSDDPGNYLCGFIYYYSMAWFWRRKCSERPVVFMHTPDLPTEEKIEEGTHVTLGLIRALVESRKKVGYNDPLGEVDVSVDYAMGAAEVMLRAEGDDSELAWTYNR